MLKYFAIGVPAFILILFEILNSSLGRGPAPKTSAAIYPAVNVALDIYRTSPEHAKKYTRLSMRSCLETYTQGPLPAYLVTLAADTSIRSLIFTSKNEVGLRGVSAEYRFTENLLSDLSVNAQYVEDRLAAEPLSVRQDAMTAVSIMTHKKEDIAACVYTGIAQKTGQRNMASSLTLARRSNSFLETKSGHSNDAVYSTSLPTANLDY